jgi:hypothetical protein
MNEQEAIETILYASAFNREDSPLTQALDMAIKALEKQIPKKPTDVITSDNEFICCICPSCEQVAVGLDDKHCRLCGQKLDWTVEE